ncbi:MAG: ImmA/IrrE family metallo-endopeptidase [Sulfuricellaceae bacterium]
MTEQSLRGYDTLAEFAPDWISAPGETIADLLEERNWSHAGLAVRTGFTEKHIHLLLQGNAPISEDTALKLERVLGGSAHFWMNLETQYREQLLRREAVDALAQEAGWLKELPLSDMLKFGWVEKAADKAQQVYACLCYFGVASVEAWRAQYERPVAAYRAAGTLTRTPAAVSAWLRQGEREAEKLRCEKFNRARFEAALQEIRTLTAEHSPKKFLPDLVRQCAQAGVAVVLAPAPKGCPVSGATKWLSADKALIMLSLRGKSDDKLWFTFFHEAGHLLKHGKRLTFLDILGEDGLNPEEEAQANSFARDFLINAANYRKFCASGQFTEAAVSAFARQEGVSPGIVVGRLQFDQRLGWNRLNQLKVTYRWDHEE